jgi:hypothetical protein
MVKKAPGWGKALGIIMICLGGLGIFYQIYKIIIPWIFGIFSRPLNDMARLSNDRAFDELNYMMGMSESQANVMIAFGIFGLVLTIFYIMGGVKLLSVAPGNYEFTKYALSAFIMLNAAAIVYFLMSHASFTIRLLMIYAIVGLVFDITLIIILLSSNKSDYGVGVDESMQAYTVDTTDEEIL